MKNRLRFKCRLLNRGAHVPMTQPSKPNDNKKMYEANKVNGKSSVALINQPTIGLINAGAKKSTARARFILPRRGITKSFHGYFYFKDFTCPFSVDHEPISEWPDRPEEWEYLHNYVIVAQYENPTHWTLLEFWIAFVLIVRAVFWCHFPMFFNTFQFLCTMASIAIITGYSLRRRPWKPDDISEFILCIMETNWITAANVQLKYLRASVPANKRQRQPLFSRHFTQTWSAVPSILNPEYECAHVRFVNAKLPLRLYCDFIEEFSKSVPNCANGCTISFQNVEI